MTCVKRLKRCYELADKKENRKDDWKDAWKTDRRQEGRREGQDEMATLIEKLILSNRISELLKVTTDKEYRNKLLIEYGIA